MNLTCLVRDSPEPPQYIFWYYNLYLIFSYLILSYLLVLQLGAHLLLQPPGWHLPDHGEGRGHGQLPAHPGNTVSGIIILYPAILYPV